MQKNSKFNDIFKVKLSQNKKLMFLNAILLSENHLRPDLCRSNFSGVLNWKFEDGSPQLIFRVVMSRHRTRA